MADVSSLDPCCKCGERLEDCESRLFFRYTIEQCAIGGTEAFVRATLPEQNVCHECAMADSELLQAMSQIEGG